MLAVSCDQIECLTDASEHAERQYIDFHHTNSVDVVLIPFNKGAILHRGIADRHHFVETLLREHKPADMLGKMARKSEQLCCEGNRTNDHGILRIKAGLANLSFTQAITITPDRIRDCARYVFRKT